jgi:hypothetical protein
MNKETNTPLQQFRVELYHTFTRRADAVFELIDALAGDTQARSPAEVSLSATFRRQYASVYDGIDGWQWDAVSLKALLHRMAPAPGNAGFRLVGIDHTPKPRPYAEKTADRGFVHQPTPIKGNKPITIGHDYSMVGQLELPNVDTWLACLDLARIPSQRTPVEVGLTQLMDLAGRCDDWLVFTADCEYGIPLSVACLAQCPHVSGVLRLRGNRTLYGQPAPYSGHGRPRRHGQGFRVNDPNTWWTPDEEETRTETDARGRAWTVRLRRWRDLHFRQAHRFGFDVIQIEVTDAHGQPRYRRPCWLLVCGRRTLSLDTCRAIYQRRPVMDHFNRFVKQRLLFTAAQFGDTQHEEKFALVTTLAYEHLYLARFDVQPSVRPWERYKPVRAADQAATPAQAQRGFARLSARIGTPARLPKPRGKSPGRAKGYCPPRRPPCPVIKKGRPGTRFAT